MTIHDFILYAYWVLYCKLVFTLCLRKPSLLNAIYIDIDMFSVLVLKLALIQRDQFVVNQLVQYFCQWMAWSVTYWCSEKRTSFLLKFFGCQIEAIKDISLVSLSSWSLYVFTIGYFILLWKIYVQEKVYQKVNI